MQDKPPTQSFTTKQKNAPSVQLHHTDIHSFLPLLLSPRSAWGGTKTQNDNGQGCKKLYQRSSADGLWNNIKPWHLQKMSASSESAVVFHRKTRGTRIAKTLIATDLVKQNGTGKICSQFLTGCWALWWPRAVSCFRSQQVSEWDKWSNCCFFIQNLETQQTSVNWSIVCGFVTNLSNTRRLCFV